ncbi:MAG TPA: BlaI/MecI/CopY family transcriptional regulator [Candidatus Acidoferrales bacterium]
MKKSSHSSLSRRERQIMDVLYKVERASVAQVLAELPAKINYSTVRAQLRVLEEKGHVRHEDDGQRYVYFPSVPRDVARRSAFRHLVDTFFEGSTERAAAALLGGEVSQLSEEELDRLQKMIAKSRKEEQR